MAPINSDVQSALRQDVACDSKVSVVSENAGLISNTARLDAIYRKISVRVLLIFMIAMVLNHVDRTNLAYAAISMNRDLGFDPKTYGLGSALFFLTFCIFQVPANLMMLRVGVRRWLSFLLVGWGCVASCFALIHNRASFFTLRLLLGVFEAGALPAMWYHLSQFFTQERLTKPYMYLTIGILLAQIVGGPLAAGFLAMDGLGGLRGWQWLFMLEGLPSVIMGFVLLFTLTDCPMSAKWLTDSEKALLEADMAEHLKNSPPREQIPRNPIRLFKMVMSNPLLLYLCFVGIMQSATSHTYILWLPQIIDALINGKALGPGAAAAKAKGAHGPKSLQLLPVILTCVPYTVGALAAFAVAACSQRRKEVYFHAAGCMLFAGVWFLVFPVLTGASFKAGFFALVMVAAGGSAAVSPKVALVARISKGPSQVVGMPMYNSISVIGGFIGPFVAGAIVQTSSTGFTVVGLVMGALISFCGVLTICLKYIEQLWLRHLAATGAADPSWMECGEQLPVHRKDSGPPLGSNGTIGAAGGKNVEDAAVGVRARGAAQHYGKASSEQQG